MRLSSHSRFRGAVAAAAALFAATMTSAQGAAAAPFQAHRVSQADPYAACTLGAEFGTVNPGAEVEPDVAVDPHDSNRVIGAFQQDRWSVGAGSKGFGVVYSRDGSHFHESTLPFTACAPGGPPTYTRASYPWVSFGPDGVAYANGIGVNYSRNATGVMSAVSYDGGASWKHVTDLIDDSSAEFGEDKVFIYADPRRAGTAYQVFNRIDYGPNGDFSSLDGRTMFSVTHDAGRTWSAPRVIVDPGSPAMTNNNLLVEDQRTGRLWDFFMLLKFDSPARTNVTYRAEQVTYSDDGGQTWEDSETVLQDDSTVDHDPNNGARLRTGAGLDDIAGLENDGATDSIAIDQRTGELYVAAAGTRFTGGTYNQIELVHSTDGGDTWSDPVRVNGDPKALAFTPVVAVAPDGTVGVSYYDIRTLRPGDTTTLPTSTWLATSPPGGTHFTDHRLAGPFDMLQAPFSNGSYFLGTYQALAAGPGGFRAMFTETNSGQPQNRSDIYTVRFPG